MVKPTLPRRDLLSLLGAALLVPRRGWAGAVETLEGRAFGTHWRISGPEGGGLEHLRPEIVRLTAAVDREMSPWRPDSTLSRFNAAPAGRYPVSRELAQVTRAALQLTLKSDGAFDPTVGPLVARWGFGPIDGSATPDWRAVSAGDATLKKTQDRLTLDLCGIAKGRALDRMAALAAAAGHENLLLDLGGEFRALGRHPAGRPWRVAIEHPRPGGAAPAVLELPARRAIATSSHRAQGYSLGGRTYGHIMDPKAQAPATGRLRAVTVVAADAMTADGWATALFAAGHETGPDLARRQGITALFLIDDGPNLQQVRTGGLEALLL